MRTLTRCCLVTAALMALTPFALASCAGASGATAALNSPSGAAPVVLADDAPAGASAAPGEEMQQGDQSRSRKKSRRARAPTQKQKIMKQIKENVPPEYQQYLQQGGTGLGGDIGGGLK